MSTHTNTPVPAGATSVLNSAVLMAGHCREAGGIVESAYRMRERLCARGLCRSTDALKASIVRLRSWRASYPCPSIPTLRAFRAGVLNDDLHAVMPHNKGGRTLLARFDTLTKDL